ncbi:hypothetical protein B0H14DRAFT_3448418 [Mycena olivaceomarginata]|nr:hypothetical protein B0H14DRAFT_3448418 [Mycena olivaceomarginata]
MKVDLDKAGDIRDASSEFGDVIQPLYLDDLVLRDLHEKKLSSIGSGNAFGLKSSGSVIPAERKKIKSNKGTLSLTDFMHVESVTVNKPWSTTEVPNLDDGAPPHTNGQKSNKRKMLSLDDFVEPEIKGKKAKTSKKKDSKATEVTLDDFVEPDPEPPKKKSKKEPTPPKLKPLVGGILPPIIGGNRYFITFADDHSGVHGTQHYGGIGGDCSRWQHVSTWTDSTKAGPKQFCAGLDGHDARLVLLDEEGALFAGTLVGISLMDNDDMQIGPAPEQ